jgi:hypothetical protein
MDKLVIGLILGSSLTFFAFLGSYFFLNWVKEKKQQIAELQGDYYAWKRKISEVEILWYEFLQWKRDKENK